MAVSAILGSVPAVAKTAPQPVPQPLPRPTPAPSGRNRPARGHHPPIGATAGGSYARLLPQVNQRRQSLWQALLPHAWLSPRGGALVERVVTDFLIITCSLLLVASLLPVLGFNSVSARTAAG